VSYNGLRPAAADPRKGVLDARGCDCGFGFAIAAHRNRAVWSGPDPLSNAERDGRVSALVKAHDALDREVDRAFGASKKPSTDKQRLELLLQSYQNLTYATG
jgi:hypothetical protein